MAAGLSGSLSVITSVIDSAVDIVSGILLWWSSRAMRKRNPYCYPQGNSVTWNLLLAAIIDNIFSTDVILRLKVLVPKLLKDKKSGLGL